MANEEPMSGADVYRSTIPTVHAIGVGDLTDALTKGIADFKAMPTHLVHFCWIYPVVVFIGARSYAGSDVLPPQSRYQLAESICYSVNHLLHGTCRDHRQGLPG